MFRSSGLVPGQPATLSGCQFPYHHRGKSDHTHPATRNPSSNYQGPGFVSSAWGIFIFREIKVSSLLFLAKQWFGLKDLATKFWIQQFNAGLEECYSLFHCLLHLVEWTDLRWLIERNSRMSPQIMHTLYYCALLVLTCVCVQVQFVLKLIRIKWKALKCKPSANCDAES